MAVTSIKLIVGLGNPGPRYAGHRHNVGFMAVDEIVRRRVFPPWRERFNGLVTEGHLGGERTIVLKPQTYMNDSGLAVRKVLAREHAPLIDMLVVADDFSLPFGKLRFREGGSSGGHNGLKSIINEMQTLKIKCADGLTRTMNDWFTWKLREQLKYYIKPEAINHP